MKVSTAAPTPPPVHAAAAPPSDRVVVVGAGPAGMATALELAQRGIPSVVLEKRDGVATRDNLFNVTPPFADRLAALDPSGGLARLLVPTERMVSQDAVTGKVGERFFEAPLEPDATRSRGDMDALTRAAGPPNAPGADTRRWSKVGIGDLENALRTLARERHGDMIELRSGAEVASVRQGDGWAEALLASDPGSGPADAVRGAMLVDASGANLLGGTRTVYPERSHWIGGRFQAPSDGDTTVVRRRAVTGEAGDAPTVTIKLPTTDRTMVWAQVPDDARAMSDPERAALLERRAADVGVTGTLATAGRTSPVSVQLWTSNEPARGRVLAVGDSVRAPYFPTSTGAAAAFIHDAPRAVDAIEEALTGTPVAQASAAYADAVRGANERLLAVSRNSMLADIGVDGAAAGDPSTVQQPAAGSGASPQVG